MGSPTQTDSQEPQARADPDGPRTIGPYRLHTRIGEGGMGVVWLADQLEPVRRAVAVKVVKTGMDTRRVVARFEAERQALAVMNHPAIAQVFDGGSTPEGRPYFVMEHIDGLPITTHCDQTRRSTRARLELFVAVCAGVQHAHQKAIIHRDLKPSNVLVALVDGVAVPKIIDFGIAKAIGPQLEERHHTALGAAVGTAGYMSPEQAQGSADIDTRTDVYSLGVVLFELLAGALPVPDQTPVPSRVSAQSAEAARARSVDPVTLRRELEGDLDAIVLKALERDRSRRYDTPSALAEDVQRFLRREPVLAKPHSAWYRARKYVERNRGLVAGASSVLVALVAGVVVSTWQAQRALRAERRAEAEAAVARVTNDFLEKDLLGQADVASQVGGTPDPDLKVRTVLERAAQKIDGAFPDQPAVEASLRTTIGDAWLGLGLTSQARAQFDRAATLAATAFGDDHPLALKAQASLVRVELAEGHPKLAVTRARALFERRQRVLGPEHVDTLASQAVLAQATYESGTYAEAEAAFTEVLAAQQRVLGPDAPATLVSMGGLAGALWVRDQHERSVVLFRDTLERQRRVLGPEHPQTLRTMARLAGVLTYWNKPAEAKALLEELLPIERRLLGPEHPRTLRAAVSLVEADTRLGKFDDAEALARATLEASARSNGPTHRETRVCRQVLGSVLVLAGRYEEAEAEFLRMGADQPPDASVLELLNTRQLLAQALAEEGRFAEAQRLFAELVAARTREQGAEHLDTLVVTGSLARYGQLALGQLDAAEATLSGLLDTERRVLGPDRLEAIEVQADRALVARTQGRLAEAEAGWRSVLEAARAALARERRADRVSEGLRAHPGARGEAGRGRR